MVIFDMRSPAAPGKVIPIKEFRGIPNDYRKEMLSFHTICQGFNNLQGKRFLFIGASARIRGKDETAAGSHNTGGIG
jgi:hypothetical protein